jgi:hypothetical protein
MLQNRVSGGLTEMFLLSMREGAVMVSTDPEQDRHLRSDGSSRRRGQGATFRFTWPIAAPVRAS